MATSFADCNDLPSWNPSCMSIGKLSTRFPPKKFIPGNAWRDSTYRYDLGDLPALASTKTGLNWAHLGSPVTETKKSDAYDKMQLPDCHGCGRGPEAQDGVDGVWLPDLETRLHRGRVFYRRLERRRKTRQRFERRRRRRIWRRCRRKSRVISRRRLDGVADAGVHWRGRGWGGGGRQVEGRLLWRHYFFKTRKIYRLKVTLKFGSISLSSQYQQSLENQLSISISIRKISIFLINIHRRCPDNKLAQTVVRRSLFWERAQPTDRRSLIKLLSRPFKIVEIRFAIVASQRVPEERLSLDGRVASSSS